MKNLIGGNKEGRVMITKEFARRAYALFQAVDHRESLKRMTTFEDFYEDMKWREDNIKPFKKSTGERKEE